MPRKKHSVEQIIHKLREAEVLLSQAKAVAGDERLSYHAAFKAELRLHNLAQECGVRQ